MLTCSKFVSSTVIHHEWIVIKNSALSHCCFIVTIQRHFLKDLLLSISISRTSLSLLFSPCHWSSLRSCSFTHIYNFPFPHPRGSFAQSQPALLIFWQLFGKGAWAAYTVYSIHAVTIYLGGLFWQGSHCQILTSAKMKTRKTAHNYTHPPRADTHWNAAYSAIL